MGKGSSRNGGGVRDNTAWGTGDVSGGYQAYTDPDAIQKHVGNQAWEDRLTDAEKEALDMYMNKDYAFKRMNEALRDGTVPDSDTGKLINDLGAALDDSYLKQNIVVARRTTPELFGGADTPTEIRKMYGDIVTDPAFLSSSAKVDYKAYQNTRPMELHIKVSGRQRGVGAYVQHFAENTDEYEFLFNRGSSFRILGAYAQGGKTHVNLEYVGRYKS